MVTAGIIAEYNPFHSGHLHHIEETRKKTGADYIIIVLSGDFVQRGEPAVADKYLRTKTALLNGADLVLELPAVYATSSAEFFAGAGVKMLHSLGVVDYLSFGSEWAEIGELEYIVNILTNESPEFSEKLKKGLKEGKNFPSARSDALAACGDRDFSGRCAALMAEPNHILGIEYMKCLKRLGSSICPVAVFREGSGYHETGLEEKYPSAAGIRAALKHPSNKDFDRIRCVLGAGSEEFLSRYRLGDTLDWEDLMPFLDYTLLTEGEETGDIYGMDAAMAARLQKKHRPGNSFAALLSVLHTRRLTDAAWRRALLHMVLRMKRQPFLTRAADVPVPYARVLGFRREASPLLRRINETASLALLQKPARGRISFAEDPAARWLFSMDVRAAELYEQLTAAKCNRSPVSEWTREQVML